MQVREGLHIVFLMKPPFLHWHLEMMDGYWLLVLVMDEWFSMMFVGNLNLSLSFVLMVIQR